MKKWNSHKLVPNLRHDFEWKNHLELPCLNSIRLPCLLFLEPQVRLGLKHQAASIFYLRFRYSSRLLQLNYLTSTSERRGSAFFSLSLPCPTKDFKGTRRSSKGTTTSTSEPVERAWRLLHLVFERIFELVDIFCVIFIVCRGISS